jgi:hypothetical protein
VLHNIFRSPGHDVLDALECAGPTYSSNLPLCDFHVFGPLRKQVRATDVGQSCQSCNVQWVLQVMLPSVCSFIVDVFLSYI